MEPTGGGLDKHDHEFDEVRFFPIAEALALLTFPTERQLVEQALPLAGICKHGTQCCRPRSSSGTARSAAD